MAATEAFDEWYIPNTQRSWYKAFLEDYQGGKLAPSVASGGAQTCSEYSNGEPPSTIPEFIEQAHFYPCLAAWLTTDKGGIYEGDIKFNEASRVTGWRQYVQP